MKGTNIVKIGLLAASLFVSQTLFAANGKISVGVMSGPEHSVAKTAKKVALEQYGLEVELVVFTQGVLPNAALVDRLLDANAFQHRPYLEQQKADRGWHELVAVGNTFVYPIAAYSKKLKDISALKDGATIAIPNDPTNTGRALLLLQAQGLIKLKDEKGLTQSLLDIVDNPKKLKIITMDANLLAKALNNVELAIINNTFSAQEGLYPNKNALFVEDKDSPYVNLIVAREDNKDDVDVINFIKSYQSEEVYQKALLEFKDSVVKGW